MGILKSKDFVAVLLAFIFCGRVSAQTPAQVKDLMRSIPHPPQVLLGLPQASGIMTGITIAINQVCTTDFTVANFKNPSIAKDLKITCSFSNLFSDYSKQIQNVGTKTSLVQFPDSCKDCVLRLYDITQLFSGNWFETMTSDSRSTATSEVRKIIVSRALAKRALESFKRVGVYFAHDDHYDMELIRYPFYTAFFNASNPISAALAYFDAVACAPSDVPCLNVKEIWGAYIAKILDANGEQIRKLQVDYDKFMKEKPTSEVARWSLIQNVVAAAAAVDGLSYDQLLANDSAGPELHALDLALDQLTDTPTNLDNQVYLNVTKAVVAFLEVRKLTERDLNFSVYDSVPLVLNLWPEYPKTQKAIQDSLNTLSNEMVLFAQKVDGGI